MKRVTAHCSTRLRALPLLLLFGNPLVAQTGDMTGMSDAPQTPAASAGEKFKPEQIDQLVAGVALYPDDLLSQILMAATYPVEVVQADRWVKQHGDLKGDALTAALEKEDWDPSVKSLVNTPQVLTMLSEKLDWTVDLGNAFIGQQEDVMAAIQKLRGKAVDNKSLQATPQQTVIIQDQGPSQVIQIESADPQVVYVPTYNPSVVYGTWPYPAYPPYYHYPAGYVATAGIAFGAGVACGAAWGYAWGNCNWHGGCVDIDCNRNLGFNRNINRNNYINHYQRNNARMQNGRGTWGHDPTHRGGVAYRDRGSADRFGGRTAGDAARARDSFRGRSGGDFGQSDGFRGNSGGFGGNRGPDRGSGVNRPNQDLPNRGSGMNRPNQDLPNRGAGQNRPSQGAGQNRPNQGMNQNRGSTSGRNSAFSDVNRGGNTARQQSNRGNSSRQMSQPSRSSGSRSSGSRGGGGGSRGGGSRGGGGRGGGGGRR